MKKLLAISTLLILSACAKERTTKHYSTEGQGKPVIGEPITFVLTNEDYEKQQADLKKEKEVTPLVTSMKEDFEQKDLAILFQSLVTPEVQLPAPEGVLCEIIPQLRLQKSLGRLTCLKQSPISDNEEHVKNSTRFSCTVDFTPNKGFESGDQSIYEALTIPEIEDEHSLPGTKTMIKQIGRFHCEKITQFDINETRYNCAAFSIFENTETKSAP